MPYCARGLYFKRWHLAKCNVPQRTGRGYTLATDATAAERRMIMSNDMTYTILFILVFLAFLIREIVRGMDDD